MTSLHDERYDSHTIFNESDFTEEEVERRNRLAMAVLEGGLAVCKHCGRAENELNESYCSEPKRVKGPVIMLSFHELFKNHLLKETEESGAERGEAISCIAAESSNMDSVTAPETVQEYIQHLEFVLSKHDLWKNKLEELGYCVYCDSIPEHHSDEPFASCKCSTGEDYAKRPLQELQVIKKERDALLARNDELITLAYKLLWLAFVWNDHNFGHPQDDAREVCRKLGINNFEEANAFLSKNPEESLIDRDARLIKATSVRMKNEKLSAAIHEAAVQCCLAPKGDESDLSEYNKGYNAALYAVSEYAEHVKRGGS